MITIFLTLKVITISDRAIKTSHPRKFLLIDRNARYKFQNILYMVSVNMLNNYTVLWYRVRHQFDANHRHFTAFVAALRNINSNNISSTRYNSPKKLKNRKHITLALRAIKMCCYRRSNNTPNFLSISRVLLSLVLLKNQHFNTRPKTETTRVDANARISGKIFWHTQTHKNT